MKFRVTMKDPDTLLDAIQDAAKELADQVTGIDEDERVSLVESKKEKLSELCRKWFEYSEYLTVEIDTEAESISVVTRR